MKKLLFFLSIIYISRIYSGKVKAFNIANANTKKAINNIIEENNLNNGYNQYYSFLNLRRESEEHNSEEKKSEEHGKNSEEHEKNSEESGKKHEEEEKKNEELEKKNEEHEKKNDESLPIEKKINRDNLLEYGSHDSDGNFIPSYKTLTDEILSTNNALEKSLNFLKISCSHILKLLEFIPEGRITSQYIKVNSKTIYLKDIGTECQNVYFTLQQLSMSIIVLNSKINKLIYTREK